MFAKEYLVVEVALPTNTFIKRFIVVKGEFPTQEFRSPGWVHSTEVGWWTRMTNFVLEELKAPLIKSGLGDSVMAT